MTETPADDRAVKNSRCGIVALLFIALVLLRIPYFFTHHVQEDAYITWRCATNLANTGVYGFNPGERSSTSTSHLYVFITTAVIKIFGERFIAVILTINSAMLVGGVYLIARQIFPDPRRRILLWVAVSMMPVSLLSSFSGMESPLLILLLGIAINGMHSQRGWACYLAAAAMFLLPWTRPDAIAMGGLILIYLLLTRPGTLWIFAAALAGGTASLGLFNYFYFGALLNQTILAKSVCYQPSHRPLAVLMHFREVFLGRAEYVGLYSPLLTKYIQPLREFCFVFAVGFMIAARLRWRREPRGRLVLLLIALAVIPPAAYAYGGVLFPWYFWPSAICAWIVILACIIDIALSWKAPQLTLPAMFGVIALLAAVQWMHSFSLGTQEYRFRGQIGRDLHELAKPTDTLLLEPAGFIPYYSKLYTWDEVGLTSPLITSYHRKFHSAWFYEFVKDHKPTYILQRGGQLAIVCNASLTPQQRAWFDEHYEKIREFNYDPTRYYTSPLALKIVGMGTARGYDLYRLRE